MISANKTDSYVPPKAKLIKLNTRGTFLNISPNTDSYRNEQMDDNTSGFDDNFWD